MPKRVDHEERRRQIADALLPAAATRGLHATGMREVAAEAGVSLRLVQYYFGTEEELLLFATQQLAAQFAERALARINRLPDRQVHRAWTGIFNEPCSGLAGKAACHHDDHGPVDIGLVVYGHPFVVPDGPPVTGDLRQGL